MITDRNLAAISGLARPETQAAGTRALIKHLQANGQNIIAISGTLNEVTTAGSVVGKVVSKTGNYTTMPTDFTIVVTSGSPTITLSTFAHARGAVLNIKNSGTGTVTVSGGTLTIDDESSQLLYPDDNIQVQYTGSEWVIL